MPLKPPPPKKLITLDNRVCNLTTFTCRIKRVYIEGSNSQHLNPKYYGEFCEGCLWWAPPQIEEQANDA